jgi:hypothetical protein
MTVGGRERNGREGTTSGTGKVLVTIGEDFYDGPRGRVRREILSELLAFVCCSSFPHASLPTVLLTKGVRCCGRTAHVWI